MFGNLVDGYRVVEIWGVELDGEYWEVGQVGVRLWVEVVRVGEKNDGKRSQGTCWRNVQRPHTYGIVPRKYPFWALEWEGLQAFGDETGTEVEADTGNLKKVWSSWNEVSENCWNDDGQNHDGTQNFYETESDYYIWGVSENYKNQDGMVCMHYQLNKGKKHNPLQMLGASCGVCQARICMHQLACQQQCRGQLHLDRLDQVGPQ